MSSIGCFPPAPPSWREVGYRYYRLSHFLRTHFGEPVRKLTFDAGLDCPNRDGHLGRGGCIFCDPASFSPARRLSIGSLSEQYVRQLAAWRGAVAPKRLLAYFQPGTNTYAPPEVLRQKFEEALSLPGMVGLIVGTRPDAVPDDVLDVLEAISRRWWVCVELGLQSIHDRSLEWMRRGHSSACFDDVVVRCCRRGLRVGAHVILGLPGESPDDMQATADALARLPLHSVKIHNLYAVKQTPLAALVERGEVQLPELGAYVDWVVSFLERLPATMVIDRLYGDAPAEYLVGPAWCRDKQAVYRAIDGELDRRDTWQGRLCVSG